MSEDKLLPSSLFAEQEHTSPYVLNEIKGEVKDYVNEA